jgi:hypothetical protein
LQDFTNSSRTLAHAMSKAEINTAGGNGAAGIPGAGGGTVPTIGDPKGTLLYDAIYLASREKLNQESGRKAMIILTDGEDQGSRTKISEAVAAAQRSNAMIYVILIADTGFYGGWGYSGYSAANRLAAASATSPSSAAATASKSKPAKATSPPPPSSDAPVLASSVPRSSTFGCHPSLHVPVRSFGRSERSALEFGYFLICGDSLQSTSHALSC